MEENIMPFSLFVREYYSAYGNFYDDKGVRVIETRQDSMEREKMRPYSDELFLKCHSISRCEDVNELIREYPTLCLLRINDSKCMEFPKYANRVKRVVRDCQKVFEVEEALRAYNKSKNYSAVSELFKEYLETGYARSSFNSSTKRYFESVTQSEDQYTAHPERISAFIERVERMIAQHSKMMTDGSTITFNPDNSKMICICDSLISAMYYQQYVNVFNNRTYRQCAHKGCNRWFLVDSHHPQTRCDEHMEARRRKRQQYKTGIATSLTKR